jgi:hypothetical protein
MIVELVSILAILVGGCAFVSAAGLTGWGVPALGYLSGVALVIGIGFVQLLSPLPSHPALTLALTVALPAGWWLVRRRRGGGGTVPWRSVAVGVICVAGLVPVLRLANLVKFHWDSTQYLMVANMLTDGTFLTGVSSELLTKRLIGVGLLHAPAHLNGEEYVRSATPLLALATLAALVWFFQQGARRWCAPWQIAIFAGLGVLLLVSTNRFVYHTFYLNGHLLFAAFFLVVVACGWLWLVRAEVPASGLMAMQLIAVPAMVLTRPEAPLMVVVALLPVLLSGHVPVRYRSSLLVTLGTATALWYAMALVVLRRHGEPVEISVYGLLALGILLLGSPVLLRWGALTRRALVPLGLTEIALWLALAGFAVRQPDILRDSLRAEWQNLVMGSGGWGPSVILLAGLALIAVALVRTPGQTALRFPLTTFIPLAFIFAYLRDVAYRPGFYDSLTRMLIQVLPVLVLGIIVAMASGSWRIQRTRSSAPGAASERDDTPSATAARPVELGKVP